MDAEDAIYRVAEAEGRGETLGEAKWAAVKELQGKFPGVGGGDVEYEIIDEPSLGGGEIVVTATLDLDLWDRREAERELPVEPRDRLRHGLERVLVGLGVRASVSIEEDSENLKAEVNGPDVGILIGKYGRTIDAVQLVMAQLVYRSREGRKRVIIDAAGYRQRRRSSVERQAKKAADEAVRFAREVELDPMGAGDRKTVHQYLGERADVGTHSEGDGAHRRVVISPVGTRRAE